MQPEITSARQIRGMKMTKFLPALSGLLNPGETSFLIGSTDTWVPAADTFVRTTQRLLVMMGKTSRRLTRGARYLDSPQHPRSAD